VKPAAPAAPPRKATPAELGAAVFLFVAMLVLTGTLIRARLEQAPVKVKDDPLGGTIIVPSVAQEGVVVTPGPGRLLSVDTTPGGADLLLDGARRGETPFSTDFACQSGQPTVLELKKAGYQVARFELDCVGGTTGGSATLKKAR
jgi:hypothetical protein